MAHPRTPGADRLVLRQLQGSAVRPGTRRIAVACGGVGGTTTTPTGSGPSCRSAGVDGTALGEGGGLLAEVGEQPLQVLACVGQHGAEVGDDELRSGGEP